MIARERKPRPTRVAAPKGSPEALASRLAREAEEVEEVEEVEAAPPAAVTIAQAVGSYVRELRTEAELSQGALAKRIGFDRVHVTRLERGIHAPSLEVVERVARALDLEPVDVVVCLDPAFRVARNLPGLRA